MIRQSNVTALKTRKTFVQESFTANCDHTGLFMHSGIIATSKQKTLTFHTLSILMGVAMRNQLEVVHPKVGVRLPDPEGASRQATTRMRFSRVQPHTNFTLLSFLIETNTSDAVAEIKLREDCYQPFDLPLILLQPPLIRMSNSTMSNIKEKQTMRKPQEMKRVLLLGNHPPQQQNDTPSISS